MEHRAVTAPLQYSAFVSYSRRDSRIASRLQRRIEGYRLPHRITAHGKKRLKPVFRDREGSSCVSAHRSRLLGTFWAPVSGRKNPVPGGSPGDGGTEQRHRAELRKNGV